MLTKPNSGPVAAAAAPSASRRRSQAGWRRWRGWLEAVVLFAVYETFEWARAKIQGKAGPSFHHAYQVIHWEQLTGIFQEARIQQWVLPHHLIIEFVDVWYGTIHFVIPPLALFLVYRRSQARYPHRRDTLIALTLLGLVCFWLWPLAPPRLLPARFHFVDTASTIGGMGPADKGNFKDDNLYAAMPSLHIGWSAWCAVVLVPILRRWWTKLLAVLYPVAMLIVVVITANHFFLDGVGGLVVLGLGWLIALGVDGVRLALR
ncbi:MAG TPA: phosphatase PAP2 family protein [Acidimicrobiales bacterium]|nr:phosphatase PAP2 family protein [Acidimicrobiales bacterium]